MLLLKHSWRMTQVHVLINVAIKVHNYSEVAKLNWRFHMDTPSVSDNDTLAEEVHIRISFIGGISCPSLKIPVTCQLFVLLVPYLLYLSSLGLFFK